MKLVEYVCNKEITLATRTVLTVNFSLKECNCASHTIDYFEHMASLQQAACTCGSIDCSSAGNQQQQQQQVPPPHQLPQLQQQQQQQQPSFVSSTLPKPLKGILKNSGNMIGPFNGANGSYQGMSYTLPRDFDVLPFDNMPPCDDCLQKARYQGSFSGDCTKDECALGSRSNMASPANTLKRGSSLRNVALTPPEMFATQLNNLKSAPSQESLGHHPGKEIVETVESSV